MNDVHDPALPWVPRRATGKVDSQEMTLPLAHWRPLSAYVLLGDPGSGKSQSMQSESAACGGRFVSARDFIAGLFDPLEPGQAVFIDGLDEVRAGQVDGRAPFEAIRIKLHALGCPRFRLSCREADWLGSSDQRHLAQVSPDGKVEVLHLAPLDEHEVEQVLLVRQLEVGDAAEFMRRARQNDLIELLGNPLMLDLMIRSVAARGWPGSRGEIYAQACRVLARESSNEHRAVHPPRAGDVEGTLHDAGLLCAVLLLSGRTHWALSSTEVGGGVELGDMPRDFPVTQAPQVLASKVFTISARGASPMHRGIAEYLGARALASRVGSGLPIGRVLALMQGGDGLPVDSLRGLFAWLAVFHLPERPRMIRLDPLGVVLNADVASFTSDEKLQLLDALQAAAVEDPWFRHEAWVSHPFGPLATADMAPTFQRLLQSGDRSESHLGFMDCVLDALRHGQAMPSLLPLLAAWVEDSSLWPGLRVSAYQAWKHNGGLGARQAKAWLDGIRDGRIVVADDRLTGLLLSDLYPEVVGPSEVFGYRRPPRKGLTVDEYWLFWVKVMFQRSRPGDAAALADALATRPFDSDEADELDSDSWVRRTSSRVVFAALCESGDQVSTERLYAWLGICLDRHGLSRIDHDAKSNLADWLSARPDRIKAVVAHGYAHIRPDSSSPHQFWQANERLHGAKLPSDWLQWLLDVAAETTNPALAERCVAEVASAVASERPASGAPSISDVERWVEAHRAKWPAAPQWLVDAWSMPIDGWQAEHYRDKAKRRAQAAEERAARARGLDPHRQALADGTAPIGVLHQLALAHGGRFTNIRGESPIDRVKDFLVADQDAAKAALKGLDKVLERADLPTVSEILALESKGRYHLVRPPALLAAERAFAADPSIVVQWPDALAERLVAFYLTDGTGEMPAWFKRLARERAEPMAKVFLAYAKAALRRKGARSITGVWALAHDEEFKPLATRVLVPLLETFPVRCSVHARAVLNRSLLSSLHILPQADAARIVRMKLEDSRIDPAQRVAWLVASMAFDEASAHTLADWVARNERRVAALADALSSQRILDRPTIHLTSQVVSRLVQAMAPMTAPDRDDEEHSVTDVHERARTVRQLLALLGADSRTEARVALQRLRQEPGLSRWVGEIDHALRSHRHAAREASLEVPAPAEVAQTLSNLIPACAADMQALVVQHLADVEADLRGADTALVRQFWTISKGSADPATENRCRDILMAQLRPRLAPLAVLLEREASAAGDTRADMRASHSTPGKRITVPIEVKKEDHRELWTAWRTQLDALYAIDPACGGRGLYLVLWFDHRPRSSPEGIRPRNAQHLRDMLVERIPVEDRARLAVMVMDLSVPGGPMA